jgi:hypothetical protein
MWWVGCCGAPDDLARDAWNPVRTRNSRAAVSDDKFPNANLHFGGGEGGKEAAKPWLHHNRESEYFVPPHSSQHRKLREKPVLEGPSA